MLLNAAIVLWVEAPGPKVALAPAYTFIAMTSIAWSLLLHRRSDRLPQYLAALVHFLFGLTQVAAAGIALSFGDEATPQMQRNYQLANFALMPSLFVAMGVSVLLLLATDLSYRLRTQALTDDLTGLSNRRGFLAGSERMLARAERAGLPVSVICCDLDYFKRVNDRHGHAAGDRALRHVAAVLTQRMRKGDEAGRLGGEEFAICLEGMDSAQAAAAVERIRRALRDTPLVVDGREIAVTASFGIASRQEGEAFERMLLRADQALYAAKEAGRDALRVSDAAGLSNEPPAAV